MMSTVIRIADHLAEAVKTRSKEGQRSMASQLEFWVTIGKAVEENPDLPFDFIKDTLLAMAEIGDNSKVEYTFG